MDAYNVPNASVSILGKGVEKHYKKHHKLDYKLDSKQDYTKHKNCSKTDNTVFDDLASHISLSAEQKDKIADLLNLFYYFIIYYSKNCFRKNADWDFKYKEQFLTLHYNIFEGVRIFPQEVKSNAHKNETAVMEVAHFLERHIY